MNQDARGAIRKEWRKDVKADLSRAKALPRRELRLSTRLKRDWQVYTFLLLPVAYLLIFNYYPMYGAQIAFKDFKASKGILGSPWVGMEHFERFVTDYQFIRVLKNTLILSIYSLAAAFPCRIALALMLNCVRSGPFRKTVQMITYMPHFISTVVMVGIVLQFFNPHLGILARLYQLLGGEKVDLNSSPAAFRHIYVWSGVWQSTGWGTIVYLAALAGVDTTQHEAALIDGANRLQRVWHIDLPAILPTMVIMLILDVGRVMNVGFEKVYLMQNNLNLRASEVISTYVYKQGFGSTVKGDFSYATAIGLFNSVINFALVITVNRIAKLLGQSSLW